MIEVAVLLAVAGLVVLLWPSPPKQSAPLSAALTSVSPTPAATDSQTFQSAMISLSHVRSRLLVTDKLNEPAKLAVECLTHNLVEGSDK